MSCIFPANIDLSDQPEGRRGLRSPKQYFRGTDLYTEGLPSTQVDTNANGTHHTVRPTCQKGSHLPWRWKTNPVWEASFAGGMYAELPLSDESERTRVRAQCAPPIGT